MISFDLFFHVVQISGDHDSSSQVPSSSSTFSTGPLLIFKPERSHHNEQSTFEAS